MLVVAATGAVVALGDTLFPDASLTQGLAADLDPTSHFLIRLRAFHPILAAAVALVILALTRRDPAFAHAGGESHRALVVSLVLAQAGFGVINLLLLAPLWLQMAHLLGSNVLWIALVWSWMGSGEAGLKLTTDN
jgi:heme A synthase